MDKITYNDIVVRFGEHQAFDLLLSVEKVARIQHDINMLDEETRFQRALEVLNNTNFAE